MNHIGKLFVIKLLIVLKIYFKNKIVLNIFIIQIPFITLNKNQEENNVKFL